MSMARAPAAGRSPAAPRREAALRRARPVIPLAVVKPRKILVVDNDPVIRAFVLMFLRKEGYEVAPAEDGISAIKVLENWTPDVMFIDLIMPNISGEKLCAVIRSIDRLKDIYLVLLSAISAEEQVRYIDYGFDAMIAKGPLKETGRHLLSILRRLEAGTLTRTDRPALGLEGLRKREITKELLWTRRHYEMILGSLSEGILEVAPDDRVVYANRAAIAMLGLADTRLLGSPFIALFTGLDRETILGHLKQDSPGTRRIGMLTFAGRRLALTLVTLVEDNERSRIVILQEAAG
jgi:PAS domain S-box-containing protein